MTKPMFFVRPPNGFDEMTDDELETWAEALVDEFWPKDSAADGDGIDARD